MNCNFSFCKFYWYTDVLLCFVRCPWMFWRAPINKMHYYYLSGCTNRCTSPVKRVWWIWCGTLILANLIHKCEWVLGQEKEKKFLYEAYCVWFFLKSQVLGQILKPAGKAWPSQCCQSKLGSSQVQPTASSCSCFPLCQDCWSRMLFSFFCSPFTKQQFALYTEVSCINLITKNKCESGLSLW